MASPYCPNPLKGTLLLLGPLLTTLLSTLCPAAPVAYQNVQIDGKTHPIVIVESHPDQSITYTIQQKPTRVALKDAPPALKKLLKPPRKQNSSPQGLSPEEIQAIKKKWDDWATRSKTLAESKKQSPRLTPTTTLTPNPNTPENPPEDTAKNQNPESNQKIPGPRGTIEQILADEDSAPAKPTRTDNDLTEAEAAPAKVLVVIQNQTPQGAIVVRYEHQTPTPSVDLLAYHVATNVPLKTPFLLSGIQGHKGQKKAVLIQNEGPHTIGGVEIQKYKVLEEMTPPPEIFMGPSS